MRRAPDLARVGRRSGRRRDIAVRSPAWVAQGLHRKPGRPGHEGHDGTEVGLDRVTRRRTASRRCFESTCTKVGLRSLSIVPSLENYTLGPHLLAVSNDFQYACK
jgi:hypothetical protein